MSCRKKQKKQQINLPNLSGFRETHRPFHRPHLLLDIIKKLEALCNKVSSSKIGINLHYLPSHTESDGSIPQRIPLVIPS